MSKDNGDKGEAKEKGALEKIRDRIKGGQNKGEREEQAAFKRTHNARERARQARVKAAKDKKDKKDKKP